MATPIDCYVDRRGGGDRRYRALGSELGWLNDKDELQQRAAQRAGYHAFLVAGLVASVLVAWIRAAEPVVKDPEELATARPLAESGVEVASPTGIEPVLPP